MSAVASAQRVLADMKREPDEEIETFAQRRYYRQMEVYSAHAMTDLTIPWDSLSAEQRQSWIESTTEICK